MHFEWIEKKKEGKKRKEKKRGADYCTVPGGCESSDELEQIGLSWDAAAAAVSYCHRLLLLLLLVKDAAAAAAIGIGRVRMRRPLVSDVAVFRTGVQL